MQGSDRHVVTLDGTEHQVVAGCGAHWGSPWRHLTRYLMRGASKFSASEWGQVDGMVCTLFRGLGRPTVGTEAGSVHHEEAAKGHGTQTGEQCQVSEAKGS